MEWTLHFKRYTFYLKLKDKYNMLVGDSGIGKSTLQIEIAHTMDSNPKCLTTGAIGVVPLLLSAPKDVSLIVLDEDVMVHLTKDIIRQMHTSDKYFLFIVRGEISTFPVSCTAVFTLKHSGRYNTLEPAYKNYDKFVKSGRYFCEDEKSGYEYLSEWLDLVTSVHGISNALDYAVYDSTFIGDGAAAGCYMNELKMGYKNLFLPISFEYLVCVTIAPRDNRVVNPYDYWDFTKHQSLEQYYTALLSDICMEKFGQAYSKKKCLPQILKLDLLGLGVENTINNSTWRSYCERYGIVDEQSELERLRALFNTQSDEDLFDKINEEFM